MPSTASIVTLLATTAATAGIIWAVHNEQVTSRAKLHAGIERDLERQERKRQNQLELAAQQALEREYRRAEQEAGQRAEQR